MLSRIYDSTQSADAAGFHNFPTHFVKNYGKSGEFSDHEYEAFSVLEGVTLATQGENVREFVAPSSPARSYMSRVRRGRPKAGSARKSTNGV